MNCPECGAPCSREEVDVGVGVIVHPDGWCCSECHWCEILAYPMSKHDWEKWLSEDTHPELAF